MDWNDRGKAEIWRATAAKQVNAKFYDLRSRRRKNADLSTDLAAYIPTYKERKNYLRYYNAYLKLAGPKSSTLENGMNLNCASID